MKIGSKELAAQFKAAAPGLSKKEIWPQATMFILDGHGSILTFNDELVVDTPSEIAKEFKGAVSSKILSFLSDLPDQEIEIEQQEDTLLIKGKTKKNSAKFPFEPQVRLPLPEWNVDEVLDNLQPLPDNFKESMIFVSSACCRSITQSAVLNCVHCADGYVEACDNTAAIRQEMDHYLNGALIPLSNLKTVLKEKPTKAYFDGEWVHFECSDTIVSSRGLPVDSRGFPDIGPLFVDSKTLYSFSFEPEAYKELSVLNSLDESFCDVVIINGKAIFIVKNYEAQVKVTVPVDNKEADVAFSTYTKTLVNTLKNTQKCSVSDNFIQFFGDTYVFALARRS